MKNILIAIMLLFSTATMAQRLSVLGIEMGTSIENAEKILKERYGEYNVYRTGKSELSTHNAIVGGSEFSSINFAFQFARYNNTAYTFLSYVNMQKYFKVYKDAKSFFDMWKAKLDAKYTFLDTRKAKNDGGKHDDIVAYYQEGVLLALTYGKSNGGDYYWYVDVYYHEDIIDESNDY